jgi:probable rRNA maturation factor
VHPKKPTLRWINRQRRHPPSLAYLRRKLDAALRRLPPARLRRLPAKISVILVSARQSGRLHHRHLGDPTPADVLAFPHGEIVVCPEVAAALCKRHRLSLRNELLTYILHGILHLAGFRDSSRTGAQSMRRLQSRLRKIR